jgi:hypothetical protein
MEISNKIIQCETDTVSALPYTRIHESKVYQLHTMKGAWRRRGIAPLFLNLRTRSR